MELRVGMTHTLTLTVTREHTAAAVGSGLVEVFATPMMVALMENTAAQAIQEGLDPNQASVGTALNITHTAATPVGMEVRATATVTEVDRSRVEFEVAAWDEAGEIGGGTHTRFVVDREKFMRRAQSRQGE